MTEEKMKLEKETKYNFSDHAEILQVLDDAFEQKVKHDPAIMEPVRKGIKAFFRTRTNSELIDIPDLEPSIWDYHDEVTMVWESECERRSFPIESELKKMYHSFSQDWSDDESYEYKFKELQKQVQGIQKKLDKIEKILGNRKFTMRLKELLGL